MDAGIRLLGLLRTIFEDMSEKIPEVAGVEPFDMFMNEELKYSLATMNTVAYFYNVLPKMLPRAELSVSQRFKTTICERKRLDIVRMQYALTSVHFPPPQKRPLPDSGLHRKEKSSTNTRKRSKATAEACRGAELDVV